MSAIPSQLTSLDFFEIKESIRSYLRTRKEFSDYDFEGSAASYLIDTLAYNTYYTAFNANMAMNEAFLETATVRDNIVRIAKQLNYTPRSVKASRACVELHVQTNQSTNGVTYPEFVTLGAGDVFVARNEADAYTFAMPQDIQVPVNQQTGVAMFNSVLIYQGNLLKADYVVDYTKKQDYIVPSEDVDTETLIVQISPSVQSSETDTYNKVTNAVAIISTSRIYYLEETDDLRYRLIFGDGVLGRKLIDGEHIKLTYIRTDGPLANGCKDFSFVGVARDSDGRAIAPQNITVKTKLAAADGEEMETPLSIKFRAPRAFATQNRAVTESDYEHIVSEIYPQAASVTAYGGEKLVPPVYGKVYIAIRPKTGTKLNESTKVGIKQDLLRYSVASIEPVIIDPTTYYIIPKSYVYYNGNQTSSAGSDISSKVLKSIDNFNRNGVTNRFGNRLEASRFGAMVDSADNSISGNVTQTTLGQNLDQFAFGNVFTQCLDFGNPLYDPNNFAGKDPNAGTGTGDDGTGTGDGKCTPSFSTVKSGTFYATGYTEDLVALAAADGTVTASFGSAVVSTSEENQVLVPVNLRDDGKGGIMLVTKRDETELILNPAAGTVDYGTGKVCVGPIAISGTPDGTTRVPLQVLPYGGAINIPPGVDPVIFNPEVFAIDYTVNDTPVPIFDPNNFSGFNFGDLNINILDYPSDTFVYPEIDNCF
tara:strand:+ start:6330 stop:8447 length:2118 start_codon:yes stop_codon:yes gene_type:complete